MHFSTAQVVLPSLCTIKLENFVQLHRSYAVFVMVKCEPDLAVYTICAVFALTNSYLR